MRRVVLFVANQAPLFLIVVVSAFLLSFAFVRNLNVEAFPDPAPPIVEIVTLYEGRSAEEVERQATIPLEVAIAGMEGLDKVNSISLYGLSDIKCKFSYGIDYRAAKQEVLNRLANITLPQGLTPTIVPNSLGEVMRYTVTGSENLIELRTLQDWTVARTLKTADGVEDVSSFGGYIKAYNVVIRPENLVKYGIPLSQVIDSLSKSNLNVGGRVIERGDQYYMVRGIGLIRSLEDVESAVVAVKNGRPIHVRNLATVEIGNIPRTGIVGLDNSDDIAMGVVFLRKDAKSIPSIRSIHEKIGELNARILPRGIRVVPIYERWTLIVTVVRKVIETAATGVALVTIALFVFLGNLRAAFLTALVIPVSLLITLAVMALRGESANLLSIGAIDFGIIADIPLIMIEDYLRLTTRHGAGSRSLLRASDEVFRPMTFSVAIILLAFIPIFMMKGAEGQIFSPMARTYIYAILFTLVLTFTYLVASTHLFLERAHDREFRFVGWLRRAYGRIVDALLRKARTALAAASVVVGAGLVAGWLAIGSQFLPKMDEGNMYIRIQFPYSISLTKTYENARRARDILSAFPEVRTVEFQVGRPEDGTDPTGPFNSEYFVDLKSYGRWRKGLTKEALEDRVRDALGTAFPHAELNVSQYIRDNLEEAMSGVKGENSVKIFGDDLKILDGLAQGAREGLEKTKGIEDVGIVRELGQPNLLVEVDRDNAGALGLTVEDILDTVSAALGGKEISRIIEGEKSFSLLVSFPPDYRTGTGKIENIPIVLPSGGVVALSRIARIRYDTGASFIYREDFRRYIPVKFSVVSKDLGGTVARAQDRVSGIRLPEAYYVEWSGMFNEMKESFKRFVVSVPIAVFLILTALYILYRSLRNVAITMAAPVLAVFAGLLSLVAAGESLSVSSIVGFISIIGVSVLNSSMIVTHYIRLKRGGMDEEAAVRETVRDKFRPVLMGGLVASVGLLPASLAHGVGSQVQRPLAIVVVGGMFVGTALILLVTPLLLRFIQVEQ